MAHEIAYLGNLNSCIGCRFTLTLDRNHPIEKISSPFPQSILSERRVNFDSENPGATSAMEIKIPNQIFMWKPTPVITSQKCTGQICCQSVIRF
ncbi:MAG: hypothetical protein LBI81_00535 [Puniceicoccales bacterium]|nr:hypothetical protein [Puniceicoccales bacterium]